MINLVKNLSVYNRRTKSSVIRELLKLTNQPGIISLAGGLPAPDLFPVETMREVVNSVLDKYSAAALQYGATEGTPELKAELVKLLKETEGLDLKPENILITTASQQGLDLIGKTFIDASDPILVELPSYIGGLQAFKSYGAEMIGVKCDDDGLLLENLELKLQKLLEEEEHYKFIYVVPDFQNPSGVTMSQKRREQLIKMSEKYDVLIIEDSPYRQIRFEGKAPDMLYKLDKSSNVISVFTFSKIFVPGLRLGFMIGHEEIIKKLSKMKQSLDLCTSPFNQLIAAEFLKGGYLPSHIEKINASYKSKKDAMLNALQEYMPKVEGISWTKPEGGLFLWLRLPEHIDTEVLFYEAIKKQVAFVIGSAFYCDKTGNNTMRLNFSYPSEEQIDEGIKRLALVVKKFL
ncbi:MAG: PLP-dependent aminotransferase family protein [Bacteriovoracaceae bacterium]|nr:PLP-dependent aminotransferase family protein [Bacteriovoracaceae bacterium]